MDATTTKFLLDWVPLIAFALIFVGYMIFAARRYRSYQQVAARSVESVQENTAELRRLSGAVERLTTTLAARQDRAGP